MYMDIAEKTASITYSQVCRTQTPILTFLHQTPDTCTVFNDMVSLAPMLY